MKIITAGSEKEMAIALNQLFLKISQEGSIAESDVQRKYDVVSKIANLFDELMTLETNLSPLFKEKLDEGHYFIRNLLEIYSEKLGLHKPMKD